MTRFLLFIKALLLLASTASAIDLEYQGSFRLGNQYAYGARSMAFDAENQSLFISAHDQPSPNQIGEVRIPATLAKGAVGSLPTAQQKQAPANIGRWSRAPRGISSAMKSGGLIVWGDRLIGTVYEYYDGDANQVDSHYMVMDKDNLAGSQVNGCYKVGTLGGGFSSGQICTVPSNWRDRIGKPMLVGGSALPINTRTSNGPCALAFDPAELAGGSATAPVFNLISYPNWGGSTGSYRNPNDHPLALPDTQNDYYNTSTEIKGAVWAEGSDELVFFGSHGTGPWSYTQGGSTDPGRPNDNVHAYPYRYQTWTYTADQLMEVKSGAKQSWQLRPEVAQLTLPYASQQYRAGGVAYDSATQRVFIAQPFADGANPVVHVYTVGVSAPDPEPDPDPDPTPDPDPVPDPAPTPDPDPTIDELRAEVARLGTLILELQTDRIALINERDNLKSSVESLQVIVASLQAEVATLKTKIANAKAALE